MSAEREASAPLRRILLVEDNPGDVVLLREALAGVGLAEGLESARDGEEALSTLERRAAVGERLPDLVLLDLNLPRLNGREFLERLPARVPEPLPAVVVLSSSESPEDREHAIRHGAAGFLGKPLTLDGYDQLAARVAAMLRARG